MPIEIVALIGLVVVFVVATTVSVNMGAIAFVASFIVGSWIAGIPVEDLVTEGFPAELFLTLVAVTYLFSIARNNGTVDWLIGSAVRLAGGRLILVPWIFFALSGLLAMAGAPLVSVMAIVAPIALAFAAQYGINPMLMGLMVVNGGAAGGLAPSSVLGSLSNTLAEDNGLDIDAGTLFLGSLAVNLVLGVVAFLIFGGPKLRGSAAAERPPAAQPSGGPGAASTTELRAGERYGTAYRVLTLAGLLTLILGALLFEANIGALAMVVAVVLSFCSPKTGTKAVGEIAWPTVLLVCGTLTYVSVLQSVGTIDFLGESVASIGVPLLAALLVCAIGALASAFASTIGMLGAMIPLAIPLLGAGGLSPTAMLTALAISALVVDASPLSSTGALVVANTAVEHRERVFRRLLVWGMSLIVLAPLVTWLVFLLPSS